MTSFMDGSLRKIRQQRGAQLSNTKSSLIKLLDLNAHHSTWDLDMADDTRASNIADQIDQSLYGVLNEAYPTRITTSCRSSPDVTLASASLLTCTELTTKFALGSDHIPIIVSMHKTVNKCLSKRKTYINFAKTDWKGFHEYTERKFTNISNQFSFKHHE